MVCCVCEGFCSVVCAVAHQACFWGDTKAAEITLFHAPVPFMPVQRCLSISWGWRTMLAVPKGLTQICAQLWLPVHGGNIFVRGASPSQALAVICGLPEHQALLDIDPSVPSSIS